MLSNCLIRFHKQSPAPDDLPLQLNQSSSSTRLLPFFLTQSSLHPCPLCSLIPNSFTSNHLISLPLHPSSVHPVALHLFIWSPHIPSSAASPTHPSSPLPSLCHAFTSHFLFTLPVFCSPPLSLIPGSFWGSKKTKKTNASLKTATLSFWPCA